MTLNCCLKVNSGITVCSTCFWAGDTFAPKLRVKTAEGELSIQAFLQGTFLNMWGVLAKAVGDLEGVLGFEVFHNIYCDGGALAWKFDNLAAAYERTS